MPAGVVGEDSVSVDSTLGYACHRVRFLDRINECATNQLTQLPSPPSAQQGKPSNTSGERVGRAAKPRASDSSRAIAKHGSCNGQRRHMSTSSTSSSGGRTDVAASWLQERLWWMLEHEELRALAGYLAVRGCVCGCVSVPCALDRMRRLGRCTHARTDKAGRQEHASDGSCAHAFPSTHTHAHRWALVWGWGSSSSSRTSLASPSTSHAPGEKEKKQQ